MAYGPGGGFDVAGGLAGSGGLAPETLAGDQTIPNFLQRLRQLKLGGGTGALLSMPPAAPEWGQTPRQGLPGLGGGPLPTPNPGVQSRVLGAPAGPIPNYAELARPSWSGVPFAAPPSPFEPAPGAGPSTKTDPSAPLKFSWGRGEPQPYAPGGTDILKMSGAPAARGGFMGAAPVAGGQKAGGFGESQTDWSKVANPMAFEGYTERPERAMIENLAQDPLWVERQKSQMEQQQKIGIGTAAIEAEAAAQQRGNEKARADVAQLAEGWINQENERRRAAGQPDMLPQDEQQWYAMAQQRYGIAPKL